MGAQWASFLFNLSHSILAMGQFCFEVSPSSNFWILKITTKTLFSEPSFSERLDLVNKLQLPFHILLFIQTRFSEQKGSNNHIH